MVRIRLVLKLLIAVVLTVSVSDIASAQHFAVGTNIGDLAALGTLNLRGQAAASQHFSFEVAGKYNPWTYAKGNPDKQMENRMLTAQAGMRWWPWTVYSEWWFGAGAQYQQYNRGGIWGRETEEGDAIGGRLAFGYSYMMTEHLNLDFGLGVWAGYTKYRTYACPSCGKLTDEGEKGFILPNDVLISILYIF